MAIFKFEVVPIVYVWILLSSHVENMDSLILSHHPSLLSITLYRSSKLHPVPALCWCVKSLLISQYWYDHVEGPKDVRHLLVHPCYYSSAQYILFILFEWFVEWVQGAVQLQFCWVLLPGLVQKLHTVFLCSYQAFSSGISLASKWCNHTVVLIWLLLGKVSVLF